MASWRKVVVSGSDANLNTLAVGTATAGNAGDIKASGKLFANASVPATGLSTFDVVIRKSDGELAITSSNVIKPSLAALTIGSALEGHETAGGADNDSFDGSTAITISVDSSSLAGQGIVADANGLNVGLLSNSGINRSSTGIAVDTASIADNLRGLKANLSSGKISVDLGSGLAFSAGGAISASFVAGAELQPGSGLSVNAGTGYDGSAAKNFSVNLDTLAGTGIGVSGTSLVVSGAASLSNNTFPIWNGDAFVDSTITVPGSNQLNVGDSSDTVTFKGNLVVQGTASFIHSDNLEVADPFVLLASGSGTEVPFGLIGPITSTAGVGFVYGGSSNQRFTFITGSNLAQGGTAGTKVGDASMVVNSSALNESSPYKAKDGNMLVKGDDIYVYF